MSEKIVSLFDHLDGEEVLPIQRSAIFDRLCSIPEDIADEYVSATNNYMEDILTWRNIISSIGHPQLCELLIEKLDTEQLERLDKIINCLASREPEKHIEELLSLSFNIDPPPIQEVKDKVVALIDFFKSRDINFQAHSYMFGLASMRCGLLADIYSGPHCLDN